MEDVMLKVENVSKQYVLGQIGGTTMRDELQRLSARLHGREDPTKRIGERDYNKGETFLALDGVSFEVKKGERVGVIGHNGAGKSTLLKLISRVTAPTSGQIGMNGRVASMLEVGTGFHGELTGRENIYMNGAILGMKKREIDAKIEDIIDFSECRQFIDTPVKRYSSGMYVKLAFSVAAHLDSEIMIMDEVLAVGDMAFQKKCLEKMNDVSRAENRTILYVSHNMNTIRQLCERVIVLDHGKNVFDGGVECGIERYMGTYGNGETCMEYDDHYTRNSPVNTPCSLKRLETVSSESMMFEQNDIVKLKLFYNVVKPVEDLFVRFEIKSASGQNVGTAFSLKPIRLEQGGQMIYVDFDTHHLAPGRYFSDIVSYQKDESGNQQLLDGVYPGFLFEIVDSSSETKLIWLSQYWGPTELHSLFAYTE